MTSTIRENTSPYRAYTPPLESGDVLDTAEYWRRYCATPEKVKAERINRKVYIMSPLRAVHHGNPHAILCHWLGTYAIHAMDVIVSDNATIRLNADNDPQPDLCLLRVNGQTHFDAEGYIIGAPELIVEIVGSSASYDFSEKRDVFEAAGVGEYLVFETIEGRIAWWRSENGRFTDIQPVDGIYKSVAYPGLWLDADALRSANALKLIQTLQQDIESV
jgi:Uma2 family endonuclease